MALIRINHTPSVRELRQFAAVWFPMFWTLVAGVMYARAGWPAAMAASIVAAGVVAGAIGVRRPAFIRPIFLLWIYAASPIGWVISHLVMGIVFYLVVTPIGIAMRLTGYDPMRRGRSRAQATSWVACDSTAPTPAYFRQY
jgi:hypothetical protein